MPKIQTRFVCQQCAHESPRWIGRCPECDAWNSFVEEHGAKPRPQGLRAGGEQVGLAGRPVSIRDVAAQSAPRFSSGIGELDRVLGGGIVPGGLILVGGDPGIGKSTLLTQVAQLAVGGRLSAVGGAPSGNDDSQPPSLYISGEESIQQIRLRSERLGNHHADFLVVNETDLASIINHIHSLQPSLVVVDSIQTTHDSTLESAPGTVSQVRGCAAALAQAAKAGGPPIFLIGHVTKEGTLAGPRVLEHMVDTVLYFEGDRHHSYRILRAVKNRFGSTDEIGVFEMREEGLMEVSNPSSAFLAERTTEASGSAVTATMEGSRPLLVEIQALVTRSWLANPRRTTTGIDANRANMLLAVLEKRMGLKLGEQDVYVNVAGGMRIIETAADLAVTMAVASNFREQPVDPGTVLIGEVGLGGEVRSVPQIEKRIGEAERLGFTRAIVGARAVPRNARGLGVDVIGVATVLDAMRAALLPL